MKRNQRTEGSKLSTVHIAEVTTGQLIAWGCIGLLTAAACFGLGIVVGRLDPTLPKGGKTEEAATPPEMQTSSVPVYSNTDSTVKTSGDAKPAGKSPAQNTPETPLPRSPFMTVSPDVTTLPPLPNESKPPLEVAAPQRSPQEGNAAAPATPPIINAAADVQAGAPAAAPVPNTPASQIPAGNTPGAATAPQAISTQPVTAPTIAPTTPPPVKTSAPAPVLTPITPEESPLELDMQEAAPPLNPPQPKGGGFGIQLGAFSGDGRMASAESLQKKLLKENRIKAEIHPSEDGLHCRVFVVYPTREAAAAALPDIRSKTGSKDAFIKAL